MGDELNQAATSGADSGVWFLVTMPPAEVDLETLANDIATMLVDGEHPIDAEAGDIMPALPAFVAQIKENALRRKKENYARRKRAES